MPDSIKNLLLEIIGLSVMGIGFLFLDMNPDEILDHYQKKLNED